MKRKLAHSLLLVVTVAALMVGGDMVREGRREVRHVDPGKVVASDQDGATGSVEAGGNPVVEVASEEMLIVKSNRSCPNSHIDW